MKKLLINDLLIVRTGCHYSLLYSEFIHFSYAADKATELWEKGDTILFWLRDSIVDIYFNKTLGEYENPFTRQD